jgi:8-oxo-dGTP diphosphatase
MPHLHTEPGGVDLCVEVFCVHQRRVLLRRHDKYDIWLGVGGHVEEDEDPAEAAVREVQEETGLELILPPPPFPGDAQHRQITLPRYLDRHRINDTHEHVAFVYFGETTTDVVVPGEGEEDVACRWLTLEQVLDPKLDLLDSIRRYAFEALEELAYPRG